MSKMKIRARYKVKGPQKVKVEVNQASIDPDTKSLIQKKVWVEKEMYMVYFPQGHSIRCDRDELVRLGYHIKPRMVDMETGDVIDLGGGEFDLDDIPDSGFELAEDDPEKDINLVMLEKANSKE